MIRLFILLLIAISCDLVLSDCITDVMNLFSHGIANSNANTHTQGATEVNSNAENGINTLGRCYSHPVRIAAV